MSNLTQTSLKGAAERLKDLGLKETTVKKEISFALQIVNKSPQLMKCSPQSVASAVVNIANIGLSLNPVLSEAYLVPRWDKKSNGMIACLEPSYRGLQKLAMEAGAVSRMNTQVVYENDVFEIDLADDVKPVTHKPDRKDRGDIIGAYCLSTLPDGTKQVEWMEYYEIQKVRDASESWKAYTEKKIPTCIWVEHEGEMIRKTVIKRAQKYLPKTDNEHLQNAIELDNRDFQASANQLGMIEGLLMRANIPEQMQNQIDRMLREDVGRIDAQNVIQYLQENQMPNTPAYGGSGQITALATAAKETADRENT